MIARSIQPFVMAGGERVDRLQALTSPQNPLREVRAQPNRVPFTTGERSRTHQGAVRNTRLPQFLNQTRSCSRLHLDVIEPDVGSRLAGEARDRW